MSALSHYSCHILRGLNTWKQSRWLILLIRSCLLLHQSVLCRRPQEREQYMADTPIYSQARTDVHKCTQCAAFCVTQTFTCNQNLHSSFITLIYSFSWQSMWLLAVLNWGWNVVGGGERRWERNGEQENVWEVFAQCVYCLCIIYELLELTITAVCRGRPLGPRGTGL